MHMRNEPSVPETLSSLRRPLMGEEGGVKNYNRIYKQGRFTLINKIPLDTKVAFSH